MSCIRKFIPFLLIFCLLASSWPAPIPFAFAANTKIRQEINVINGYLGAASGSYATSSAIIQIDTTKYTGATYYFEVVASTTSAVSSDIYLKDATTYATVATIAYSNSNTYTLYRSDSFTPTSGANNYVVVVGNAAVQKGVQAARVVILQEAASISTTQTQIEIGNKETYSSTATTTLSAPKYWRYDSSKWDASPTFYAEVTYARTTDASSSVASSTTYSTAGTYTVVTPTGTASTSVQVWGGGGGGGAASTNTSGSGSGGAGGTYAKKTIVGLTGSKTLVVGAAGIGGVSTVAGGQGATTTWDGTVVVAGGGMGGLVNSGAGGTGLTTGSTGDIVNAGGNGAAGTASGISGGGGEGGSMGGTGGSASTGTGGSGGGSGEGGDGANGSTGNGTGATGSNPGGGGAGGRSTGNPNADGGPGGVGQAIITNDIVTSRNATTTIALQEDNGSFSGWADKITVVAAGTASTPTLVRTSSFTPVTGRNYRIVFKSGYDGAVFAIYNAKIIVDQTSPTLLEPQYLLANTTLGSGTGLQKFLTSWSSGEWVNATNVYIHEINSGAGSSVVEVDTAGGTLVADSSVTGDAVRKRSSGITMPSNGNLDMKATTNNGDVYASRILVQVSLSAAIPATPSVATRLRNGIMKIIGGKMRVR